jgi:hypothetical protein
LIMKKIISLLCLVSITGISFSQDYSMAKRAISQEEYDLKYYDKDREAEAVILFDIGESLFFEAKEGYDIRFTRTKRIKIFKNAGIKFSEITIPFYVDGFGKTEEVVSIAAVTVNVENNQTIRKVLDPANIYEVTINERWKAKRFTFPDVKEGSIIEYSYVLETPFHFNLPDWQFQDLIPTVYSEYTLKIIPFYEYSFIAKNISRFDLQKSYPSAEKRTFGSVNMLNGKNYGSGFEFTDMIHVFVKKDIPAFKDEAYITSVDDYIMKIDFQLSKFNSPNGTSNEIITTWPKLVDMLLREERFGKFMEKAGSQAKKDLKLLTIDDLSMEEKSQRIINYVKSNFSWNGRHDKYASKTPKEFFSHKTGNSADINLYLCTLLSAAGIQARPVIISTRGHGKILSDHPFSHFFNYVIVLVNIDNKPFLTDGTESFLAYNRIPPRCMNDVGLIIEKKNEGWVDLNSKTSSIDIKQIGMVIDPEKKLANTLVNIQSTELDSYHLKNTFRNDSSLFKKHLQDKGFLNVNDIKMLNIDKNSHPYLITFKADLPVDYFDDKLFVSPFLGLPDKENKLKQPARTYPVDFIYAKKEEYLATIKIPDGYRVFSLPDKVDVKNDMLEIFASYIQDGEIIELKAYYHRKKGIYPPNEYKQIKNHLDVLEKVFSEQLVFVKE